MLLSLGRHEEVVPDLTAMVADHPLRERMRGLLMVALYRCGRHAEALRVFRDGRRVLAEELGIDPGGDLSRIHQQVLTMDPALAVAGRPGRGHAGGGPGTAGAGPAPDDGQRRPRPEGRVTPVPAQLPLDAPGFSGRREELSMLQAMLPAKPGGLPDRGQRVRGQRVRSQRARRAESGPEGQDQQGPARRCRSWSSRARRERARPRSPSGSATRSPGGSPTASCTSTCAAWIPPPRRWSQPRRCASSSTRWACRRTGSRPTSRAGPRCSAACSTGRRMLIVLDNARNVAQVRPLLPGSPGCLVVVTSRNELTGLVAAEGAVPLTLDVLGDAEAHEMLARRLGHGPGRGRARGGGRDHRGVRPAPAGPGHRGRPRGRAAQAPADRARRRAARRAGQAGRARGRRRDDRRAGRAVLVLRPALRARGADVPPARRAPGPGHLAVGGGQPGRDARGPPRVPRCASWPGPTWSPSTCRAGSPSTTCSGRTRPTRPSGTTRSPSAGPRRTGCSTTTCTRRWRPPTGSARTGPRCSWQARSRACCPPT